MDRINKSCTTCINRNRLCKMGPVPECTQADFKFWDDGTMEPNLHPITPQHKTLKEIYGTLLQVQTNLEDLYRFAWFAASIIFAVWLATTIKNCTGG